MSKRLERFRRFWSQRLDAEVLLWAGFTAATTVGTTLYSRRSWSFWWKNNSYFLIVMAVNSALLATWT